MPWIGKTGVARSRKEDLRFRKESQFDEHALGIRVDVVCRHSVVRTQVVKPHSFLKVTELRSGFSNRYGSPTKVTLKTATVAGNHGIVLFFHQFHLFGFDGVITELLIALLVSLSRLQ